MEERKITVGEVLELADRGVNPIYIRLYNSNYDNLGLMPSDSILLDDICDRVVERINVATIQIELTEVPILEIVLDDGGKKQ